MGADKELDQETVSAVNGHYSQAQAKFRELAEGVNGDKLYSLGIEMGLVRKQAERFKETGTSYEVGVIPSAENISTLSKLGYVCLENGSDISQITGLTKREIRDINRNMKTDASGRFRYDIGVPYDSFGKLVAKQSPEPIERKSVPRVQSDDTITESSLVDLCLELDC